MNKNFISKKEIFIDELSMLYHEPLNGFVYTDFAEMSDYDLSFLCGVIKKYIPKKILEIGVAAGATTSLIMKCCKMLELDTEIHFVDINHYYYKDASKLTGYIALDCQKKLNYDHFYLYTGKTYIEFADDIGDDIDLVVIDTIHLFPGELFDFLAILPHLKIGSVVIFHDMTNSHDITKKDGDFLQTIKGGFATASVFTASVGEKYWGKDKTSDNYELSNISVLQIINDTYKYIENLFCLFILPWAYDPGNTVYKYRTYYEKYYSRNLLEFYDNAVRLGLRTLNAFNARFFLQDRVLADDLRLFINNSESPLYIYGAGRKGKDLYNWIKYNSDPSKIYGFVVSDLHSLDQDTDAEIKHLSDLPSDVGIIVSVSAAYKNEIINELKNRNIKNVFFI